MKELLTETVMRSTNVAREFAARREGRDETEVGREKSGWNVTGWGMACRFGSVNASLPVGTCVCCIVLHIRCVLLVISWNENLPSRST